MFLFQEFIAFQESETKFSGRLPKLLGSCRAAAELFWRAAENLGARAAKNYGPRSETRGRKEMTFKNTTISNAINRSLPKSTKT